MSRREFNVTIDPKTLRRRTVIGTVLLSIHQLTEALVPLLIGVIIDTAVLPGDPVALVSWLLVLAALFVALMLAWRYGARNMEYAVMTRAHLMRSAIVDRVLDPRGLRTEHASGELVSIAGTDADRASTVIESRMIMVAAAVGMAASAVMLFAIDPVLGVVVLVGAPVVMILVQLFANRISATTERAQAAIGHSAALATDLVSGLRALRGVGASGSASRRYVERSAEARQRAVEAAVPTAAQAGLGAGLAGIFLAAVVAVSAPMALSGRISLGELVAVVGLAQFVAEPLSTLVRQFRALAVARGSARRVRAVLDAPYDVDAQESMALPGPIDLQIDLPLVAGGTAEIAVGPGEFVAVVADDPRDAATLQRLLRGTELLDAASVRIAGRGVAELGLPTVRAHVHLEPTQAQLFEGTIGHNLLALTDDEREPAPTIDGVEQILAASAADELVAAHPDGIDRVLTDRGSNLSGGQRQRLALARSLLAGPPVLVLTEPTTAVDAATEARIAEGLVDLRVGQGLATLAVTSSPALLDRAHRVVSIVGGVVATGSHHELLSSAAYREVVLR